MSRTSAREVAMMIHYSGLLGGEDTPERVCEKNEALGSLDEEDLRYVSSMLEGVNNHSGEIDELVSRFSKDWAIERIARVDLSILRVAIYEMLYRKEDVPAGAAINEAVELAKRYGGERSYAFVNGILGSVAKEIVSS
jgi:N utilization substance protein B